MSNKLIYKIHTLIEDPKKHKGDKGPYWSLHYDGLYTSVIMQRCPQIEELKKGDKIRVGKIGPRVVSVEINIDPLNDLDNLEEKVK